MAERSTSTVESRSDVGMYVVGASAITPGWMDGRRVRRQVQNPFLNRMLARFFPDQRRYPRFFAPPIVAYLGSTGSSKVIPIVDVSVGGFRLRADEFWSLGTVMPITLQKWNRIPQDDPESITVQAMLVRRDGDAAGFAIAVDPERSLLFPGHRVQRAGHLHRQMVEFLKGLAAPVPQPKTAPMSAAAVRVITKAERMELLLERAKNHKVSEGSGTWWGEEERDSRR